ncbi:MAG: hypothetical protein H6719_23380 [Sandaracinaceae bacterium]|nr:hypothetical protein [Sandaracinaceae bacterium]
MHECPTCLLTSEASQDVFRFFWPDQEVRAALSADGPCSFCRDVARYLDPARLLAERDAFFERARRPVFLAYSGGKDSTAALHHLRRDLGVEVVAVLFDNGFIPDVVLEYARSVCDRLDAELVIDREPVGRERLQRGFARRLQVAFRGPRNDVCTVCSKTFLRRFHRMMVERGADSIALGNNFWSHSPHTSGHADPPHMTATWDRVLPGGEVLHNINLPFASRITLARTRAILDEIGFHDAKFTGYTSNCVLSDFQDHVRARDGQRTDWGREYLSLEVSAGYVTRAEALSMLDASRAGPDEALMARIEAALRSARPI